MISIRSPFFVRVESAGRVVIGDRGTTSLIVNQYQVPLVLSLTFTRWRPSEIPVDAPLIADTAVQSPNSHPYSSSVNTEQHQEPTSLPACPCPMGAATWGQPFAGSGGPVCSEQYPHPLPRAAHQGMRFFTTALGPHNNSSPISVRPNGRTAFLWRTRLRRFLLQKR